MRNLSLALILAVGPSSLVWAQQEIQITDAKALDHASDVRKMKGAAEAMTAAGLTADEVSTVLEYGDLAKWPEGLRTDTSRAVNAPYIHNYVGFRLCNFQVDTAEYAVVMIPGAYNLHMPESLRPLGDFFLTLPRQALTDAEKPKPRPAVSKGPRWSHRPKAKIMQPDGLYGAYNLGSDSVGLRALERLGLSRAEIDAVVFRSTEHNWPEGINNFETRSQRLEQFRKYRAYYATQWDDKVLLIIPTAKNRRMPVLMRPYMDLYFVYSKEGVKVKHKK